MDAKLMNCPYCSEEIKETALKCRHCGEWLPKVSYLFPANKEKSNFNDLFVIDLEGSEISIERRPDGDILISKDGAPYNKISKKESCKISEMEVNAHELKIQYKEFGSLIGLMFWWNSGLIIYVDGKPVERTLDDPSEKIKYASYSFIIYGVMSIINVIFQKTDVERVVALFILIIFIICYFTIKKVPVFITLLGSLWGIIDVILFIDQSISTNYIGKNIGWFMFWLFIRVGATLALIQGFIFSLKIRKFKKFFQK